MKKCILLLIIIFVFYVFISNNLAKNLTIPGDAIRIRIIPNSNSDFDQSVKLSVKDKVEVTMYDLLKDARNSSEARNIIKDNMGIVRNDIENVLKEKDYNLGYDVNFGKNYFPSKEYKGVKYDEGYYESLLITLGNGEGDNWWCVLFPPLCLIEGEENTDVEYKSLIDELLKKYF